MTFEEAKKILEKEGFYVGKATRPYAISEAFTEHEDPSICKAMQVVSSAGYMIKMEVCDFNARKARLKKEHEKHANASDKMGMTLKEAKDILKKEFAVIGIHKTTEPFEFDESRWIEHENPSVLEAFRVLAKEGYYVTISGHDYTMREKRLNKEYEENTKAPGSADNHIKEDSVVNPALKESASQFNDALLDEQGKKIKRLTKKIARLNKIIHKKNEELRLTKIREKNLAELGLKYVGENEKLKNELADKVVDKIDAQALKSAESALAYKEKVIDDLKEHLAESKESAMNYASLLSDAYEELCELKKKYAEKDEVIADLGKELAATKNELEEKTNLVEMVRKGSKEYREYGIAALSMIRKMAKVIVNGGPVSSKDFKEYRRLANGYSFNPQLPDFSEEEEKKLTAKTLDFNAKCMKAARESINDVFESYAAKYAKSSLDDLKEKAYESFNAKAHKLGLVGSEDGKGIPDQMIRVDIAEELSKVLNDVIDQFLLFGEIIIKSEK
jgi:uncharacterized coiled-coil protein SlyX